MPKLNNNEKLSIVFDDSNDQPERFPDGYYIAVILEWTGKMWVNSGFVRHVVSLAELDNLLLEREKALINESNVHRCK